MHCVALRVILVSDYPRTSRPLHSTAFFKGICIVDARFGALPSNKSSLPSAFLVAHSHRLSWLLPRHFCYSKLNFLGELKMVLTAGPIGINIVLETAGRRGANDNALATESKSQGRPESQHGMMTYV